MSDEPTRVTDAEATEAARVLRKIEDLELTGDDIESSSFEIVRKRLERWVQERSGICSLQGYQDEVFKNRAEEALLDLDTENHNKWMRLVRTEEKTA